MAGKNRAADFVAGLMLLLTAHLASAALAQEGADSITGFRRDPIHVVAWPGGKKVAVSFALFVEEFGFGQGPVFRPDLANRNPDLVNEAFRQYGIDWGIPRVGRVFKELNVPLTIVLNAEFPAAHPIRVEAIPCDASRCTDCRAWHEQYQPHAAARAWAR